MAKRVTSIILNNYKGYFGKYDPICLPNGENVLIYGENGSGKSSLYKALNNFLLSSRNPSIEFIKNKYNENENGEIRIEFSDYDNSTEKIIVGSDINYSFTDSLSNHSIQFIQDAALVKGFLDYTDLLRVHFYEDPKPNLFKLIVLTILGEHIPISSGGNFKFKKRWDELQNNLIKYPYNRNDRKHKTALNFLPIFETHLRTTLDEVFQKLNDYLKKYFINFDIELKYNLLPLTFNYPQWNKSSWFTTADLKLIIKKDGWNFTYGFSDYLNEARLSAIGVCMYLASLRVTNKNIDLKVLYLDDVFIGLDSGNRIPILNILRDEFSDYQKFISTYDRHWFELAKRQFQIYNEKSWKYIEMYVGHEIDSNGNRINKPIINNGSSYSEKGTFYLHHSLHPDYPAAANYYRKALEELISVYVPEYELADGDNTQIPEYKLGKLLDRCCKVLEKTNNDTTYIRVIQGHLYSLLHPLPHHEITSLIYKQELESIERVFSKLKELLQHINLRENYQCIQGKESRLRIHFVIDSSINHIQNYEFILNESLLLFRKADGSLDITKSDCFIYKLDGTKDDGFKNGKRNFTKTLKKNNPNFRYSSLSEVVNKTYLHITSIEGYSFVQPVNPTDVIEYFDGTNWQSLNNLLIWK